MRIVRGCWLLLLALLVPALPAAAAPASEVVTLWTGRAPGTAPANPLREKIGTKGAALGAHTGVSVPRMEVYRPARPNGTAVLVISGGGYHRIQIGTAGRPVAERLAREGVTAFLLYYRLPKDGWNADAPFQDGQRAMRLIRAQAPRWRIDPARVGALGFSAGGHLAAILATRGNDAFYPARDAADRQSAIPAFAGLVYPVISLLPPLDTTQSAKNLRPLGDLARWSAERLVNAATPPIFLAHAADDPIAAVGHSLAMDRALRTANRDVELHIFRSGGHSWGLGKPGSAVAAWPGLFVNWMRGHGWVGAPPPAAVQQAADD